MFRKPKQKIRKLSDTWFLSLEIKMKLQLPSCMFLGSVMNVEMSPAETSIQGKVLLCNLHLQ